MSLSTILSIGTDSLANSRAGIETTGHNIANVHTDGYSRQTVQQNARPPRTKGLNIFGTGAYIQGIVRSHDRYIERSLQNEVQTSSKLESMKIGLERLEEIFSPEIEGSVLQQYDMFKAAVNELALYPEEMAIRTNVRDYGQTLGRSFKQADEVANTVKLDYNAMIEDEVKVINGTVTEIADLNMKIKEMEVSGSSQANDLRDSRDQRLIELAKRINIQWYEDKNHNNLVVRGPKGTLLIEGRNCGQLKVGGNQQNEGLLDVFFTDYSQSSVHNITADIKAGSLYGFLQVRDQFTTQVRDRLDELAYTFSNKFNEVHKMGYGIGNYASDTGRNFFNPLEQMKGAAGNLMVDDSVSNDINAIGAGISKDSPGDNIIANQLSLVFEDRLFNQGAANFNSIYADEAGRVGIEVDNLNMLLENSSAIVNQLKNRKEAVSGVSLDAEAAEMVKYQHLFAASSKLITTTDEMYETILNLKR